MIWDKKRYKGVQVYVGKQKGDFAGEYIVVYKCNGSYAGNYDAQVGLKKGDIIPNVGGSVSAGCLYFDYREVSQRKIPEHIQKRLASMVTGA
jgi:hypothetical protein